jgi:lipid-A-disaccharide synthase
MVYRLNPLTYMLRPIVDLENYSLVNVLARRKVIPELVQGDCTPVRVADQTLDLLGASGVIQRRHFAELRSRLGEEGANARAAQVLLAMLPGAREAEEPG